MREERKKGKKKGIYTILMLICAVVFLFALYKVVDILMEYKQIDDFYDGAQEEYVDLDSQGRVNDILLSSLIAENSDVKGWIYIEDTEISYPILQGPNNQYYLYRAYNKQYLGAGSIFLESLNSPDFTDSHTIIFGHNMHNGSMFGQLDKFFDEEYRNDHSHVYIKLPDGTWNVYEIFAMYTAGIEDGTFVVFDENQTEYDNYLALIQEKNVYQSTQPPSDGERIFTLSTCTEDSDDYKRNVIQAKFVENVEKITY